MPPEKSHKKLTDVQKETLKRWVASGAEYQLHWSLIPPQRPALPRGEERWLGPQSHRRALSSPSWKNGPAAGAEADRRTLARRLSLDLTGLPPAPAEVEAFVQDTSARRLREIRRSAAGHAGTGANIAAATGSTLPATPTRMAFTSTTIARSGRTATGSSTPSTATCRSIASPSSSWPATCCPIARSTSRSPPASIAATSPRTRAGRSTRNTSCYYTRDRTETTSLVWLGMTAGCAVCHDHKFDPLSQKEFYSLAAFFNNTTQARDGRQHQGHAADADGAAGRGPPTLGCADKGAGGSCASR